MCNKIDLFKRTGKIITVTKTIQKIDSLYLNDNIDFNIIEDSTEKIEITAGENLIKKIIILQTGKTLTIKNNNKANFTRNISIPIQINIHCNNLSYIKYSGNGIVNCQQYPLDKSFITIDNDNGTGTLNLNFNSSWCLVNYKTGTNDINITGVCKNTQLYSGGLGKINCEQLNANYISVRNNSTNNFYIQAKDSIYAIIESIGNIYYKGNTSKIKLTKTNKGLLIPY